MKQRPADDQEFSPGRKPKRFGGGKPPFGKPKFGKPKFGKPGGFSEKPQAQGGEDQPQSGDYPRPRFGKRPFGKPAFGKPAFGEGDRKFGKRPFGKPKFGKPGGFSEKPQAQGGEDQPQGGDYPRPRFGKPKFGKPAFGKPKFGEGDRKFDKPRFGKPAFGKPKFGEDRKPYARPPVHDEDARPRRYQDQGEAEYAAPPERPVRTYGPPPQPVELPPGTPVVHLKSISYGAFIYNRMVGDVEGPAQDGELVAVKDKFGRLFGWGFYHSNSQIALRMFTYGGPRPDESLVKDRVRRAVELRRDVLNLPATTSAFRLIHAEGDGLSGLIVDRYGRHVAIELFSLAMFKRLDAIQDAIVDAGLDVEDFIVRADKNICAQEGFRVDKVGERKGDVEIIEENGVKFAVDLAKGHKTGFFCDQRENRLALSKLTAGKSMLDVCCYTGGFSVYAGSVGCAASVTGVDLDETILPLARRNAELNSAKVEYTHADAFDYLRSAGHEGRKWDVVVVDPSKFVGRRDMMEVGLRKYADLNRLAAAVVSPGGIMLTCSCSGLVSQDVFLQTIGRAVRSAGRSLQVLRTSGAGPDHPVMAETPESAYLKAVWARVL